MRKLSLRKNSSRISRERAVVIASNHNCVPIEVANKYTDSELREVLLVLKLKAGF